MHPCYQIDFYRVHPVFWPLTGWWPHSAGGLCLLVVRLAGWTSPAPRVRTGASLAGAARALCSTHHSLPTALPTPTNTQTTQLQRPEKQYYYSFISWSVQWNFKVLVLINSFVTHVAVTTARNWQQVIQNLGQVESNQPRRAVMPIHTSMPFTFWIKGKQILALEASIDNGCYGLWWCICRTKSIKWSQDFVGEQPEEINHKFCHWKRKKNILKLTKLTHPAQGFQRISSVAKLLL